MTESERDKGREGDSSRARHGRMGRILFLCGRSADRPDANELLSIIGLW